MQVNQKHHLAIQLRSLLTSLKFCQENCSTTADRTEILTDPERGCPGSGHILPNSLTETVLGRDKENTKSCS